MKIVENRNLLISIRSRPISKTPMLGLRSEPREVIYEMVLMASLQQKKGKRQININAPRISLVEYFSTIGNL